MEEKRERAKARANLAARFHSYLKKRHGENCLIHGNLASLANCQVKNAWVPDLKDTVGVRMVCSS